ncbi:MAG: NAD-dependent epimerase/dehydratase family protein [Candidatus Nanosalina sp.]
MRSKVVVTGVAGFIGSHQAEFLLEKGFHVVGIDNFHPYYSREIKENNLEEVRKTAGESPGEFRFIEGSILRKNDLVKLPDEPEKVFHLAALAGTRSSFENPSEYFEVNVLGTSRLIQSFESIGKLIFTSSSSVYGEVQEEELPVEEDRELNPETPYSLSKAEAEDLVRMYSEIFDFDFAITRPFTVYGPRQRPDEVFTKFIARAIEGKPVEIYGTGEQSRDFTFVGDVVRGNYKAAEKGRGVYNLGSQRRVTVEEVVDVLEEAMEGGIERVYEDRQKGDVSHTHADISKAAEHFSYSPSKSIRSGAEECAEWVESMKRRELI